MEKLQVIGFFEVLKTTKDGAINYIEKSSSRLFMLFAFFCISMPGTFIVLLDARVMFMKEGFTWQQLIYTATVLIILNLLWIAPKSVAKMAEEKGLPNKLIDKG